jgi:predicted membrane protein
MEAQMGPESDRDDDPGDAYARSLKDRIVTEAREQASAWTGSPRHRRGITPRLVLGLLIMLAGILLALDNLGLLDAGLFLRFWPLALVVLGVVKLTAAAPGSRPQGGVFWIVLGGVLLAFNLGYLNWPRLWAFLFVFVGASIAWRAVRAPVPMARGSQGSTGIDMMALLGGAKTVSNSPDFRGGQALAFMGGCEIDLRRARIAQGEATLDVFAFWGGIEIRVPEEWEVVNRVNAVLGGSDNKTRIEPGTQQRFVLTGTVIMGGVEVKN